MFSNIYVWECDSLHKELSIDKKVGEANVLLRKPYTSVLRKPGELVTFYRTNNSEALLRMHFSSIF